MRWLRHFWVFHACHSTAFWSHGFSLGMFHTLSVALWWHLSHLVATCSTECKIGLVHHLADERRCDNIWWSCCRSCGKIPQAFSLHALLHTTSDQELEVQKLGPGMRLEKGSNGLSCGQITSANYIPSEYPLAVEEVTLKMILTPSLCSEDYWWKQIPLTLSLVISLSKEVSNVHSIIQVSYRFLCLLLQ